MIRAGICFFGVLVLLVSTATSAHKASDSFIYLDQSGETTTLRIDVALRDLALVVPLDQNLDQQVTGAEFSAARGQITSYFAQGLTLSGAGGACRLVGRKWGLSEHSDGPYAAANYDVICPDGAHASQMTYQMLFDTDPLHRALVQHTGKKGERLLVIGPAAPTVALASHQVTAIATFTDFLYQGVLHLVLGYDHVLFLLVLILPATLAMDGPRNLGIRRRILELATVVTAFTTAHSLTLGLSALDIMRPPIAWVEMIIALSIGVAAINLFWPVLGRKTWKLAFIFGLIHGFGFASVLAELTSGTSQTILALAGFNLGVELGQLALLALVFPLLLWISRYRLYQQAAVPAIALIVSLVSVYWVIDRAAIL